MNLCEVYNSLQASRLGSLSCKPRIYGSLHPFGAYVSGEKLPKLSEAGVVRDMSVA